MEWEFAAEGRQAGKASDSETGEPAGARTFFGMRWADLPGPWQAVRDRLSGAWHRQAALRAVPWTRVIVLVLATVVLLRKDVQLSLAMKAPLPPVGPVAAAESPPGLGVAPAERLSAPATLYSLEDLPPREIRDYLHRHTHIALAEMRDHQVPASIHLAMGLLESGAGRHHLTRNDNNHFPQTLAGQSFVSPWDSWVDHGGWMNRAMGEDLPPIPDYRLWLAALRRHPELVDEGYRRRLAGVISDLRLDRYDALFSGMPAR